MGVYQLIARSLNSSEGQPLSYERLSLRFCVSLCC